MVIDLGEPNAKQDKALKDHHRHVAFGGARGGGKSWFIRAKAVILCSRHKGIKVMIVRKSYPELIANHVKPLKEMLHVGQAGSPAKYNSSEKEFRFINGSTILLRYCDTEKDVDRYQGTEVDVLFFDEATQLSEEQMKKINACVRGVNDFPHRTYYTCNPSGIGHGYIKRIFIDRNFEATENPEDYSFIQSLVSDNKALMESDPEYVRQLEALPHKYRLAWLEGRWDVFQGAFFEEFRPTPDKYECEAAGISLEQAAAEHRWTHVIEPFEIPRSWRIYRSYDWGYGKPFSVGWWAHSEDDVLYRILELYGCTQTANEGIKWTNKQQMDEIQRVESEHPWLRGKHITGVADPSIWDGSHDTYGVSCADEADKHGIFFEKGNNERIAGWMQVRERLKFDEEGNAMIYFFSNCKAAIRTLPLMMFDEHKCEDMDTELEDHACLVGETEIVTPEGIKHIEDMQGTTGQVLSSDGRYHRYYDCMLTRRAAKVYRVTLEDGSTVTGTSDHRILMSDGTWKQIGELLEGDDVWKQ